MKYMTLLLFSSLIFISGCKEQLKDIIEDIAGEVVELANPPAETNSKPGDPPRVLPANPAGCPDWKKESTVEITESITLPAGCKYDRVSLLISNQSDLTLDCNGAELNGLDKEFRQEVNVDYSLESAPRDFGIQISSYETIPSRNITIRNCNLRNYVRGIRVVFGRSAESNSDLQNNINVDALEDYLRSVSPKNIRVENSHIDFSHKDGVFVGRFITDFVLDNSSITYSGAVGLYLDSGSRGNTIKNSTFTHNGYSDYDLDKRLRKIKLANDTREGIAIDSSAYNSIENNLFSRNAGGAIFLYKNCNEHYQDPNQIPRYQSSDYNQISGNEFHNEATGIWIASRQSKDLNNLECGSPIMDTGVIRYGPVERDAKYYEDFAKHNTVSDNRFLNVNKGIYIEDDYNSVLGNLFEGNSDYDVQVGTPIRTYKLEHPVTGTRIENNQFKTSTPTHIRLVHEPQDTIIRNNVPDALNSLDE